jgi:hypothetical protein
MGQNFEILSNFRDTDSETIKKLQSTWITDDDDDDDDDIKLMPVCNVSIAGRYFT